MKNADSKDDQADRKKVKTAQKTGCLPVCRLF